MYFVGFVVFIAFSIYYFGIWFFGIFIDLPSILIILAFSLPMLMASGLFSDFIRAFKIMGKK